MKKTILTTITAMALSTLVQATTKDDPVMTEFDARGLEKITKIGDNFLKAHTPEENKKRMKEMEKEEQENLKDIDLSGLKDVKKIGDNFLKNNTSEEIEKRMKEMKKQQISETN